jgi:hypothetical protein
LTARCSITWSVFYGCSGLLQALPLVMIATFHDDDPELATPVLERVCNQTTVTEQPATTAQLPSYEVSSPDDRDVSAEDARAADSLGPMMSVIAASDSVSLQA